MRTYPSARRGVGVGRTGRQANVAWTRAGLGCTSVRRARLSTFAVTRSHSQTYSSRRGTRTTMRTPRAVTC